MSPDGRISTIPGNVSVRFIRLLKNGLTAWAIGPTGGIFYVPEARSRLKFAIQPVITPFPGCYPTSGRCQGQHRLGDGPALAKQSAHAGQVVGRQGEHGLRRPLFQAAELGFAKATDGFGPADELFDPLAQREAGGIPGMAGGVRPSMAEPLDF